MEYGKAALDFLTLKKQLGFNDRQDRRSGGARSRLGCSRCPAFLFGMKKGWDSPYINHFLQPDTIIPNQANPRSWNRYSYVSNNPIRNTDPTGHKCIGDPGECFKNGDKKGGGFTGDPHELGSKGCGGNHAKNCDGTPKYTVSESTQTGGDRTGQNACMAQPQGYSTAQVLSGLRSFCGNIDPALPNYALVGTNLSYSEAVRQSAEALGVYASGNPYSKILMGFAAFTPGACTIYDCAYDLITGTGEYSTLKPNVNVTPQAATYTILSGLVIAPAVPQILEFLAVIFL